MACTQSRWCATVDDDPPVEKNYLVADLSREVEVLRCEQNTAPARCTCGKSLTENDDRFGIEGCSRLVYEDERSTERKSGNGACLPPEPARERAETLLESVAEAERRRKDERTLSGLVAHTPERMGERDELGTCQLVEPTRLVRHERNRSACGARPGGRSCHRDRPLVDRDQPCRRT